jgi:[ribosomal protein S5]-alanine N-acetyltransferase
MKTSRDSIVTSRLYLRRFTAGDLDLLAELYADPEVMRYVGGVKSRDQVAEALKTRTLVYYDEHPGLGMWATMEKATGRCIGTHLLNNIQGETLLQVGYILFKPFWGHGYATEMCVGVLRYGFTELGLPQIVAITDLPNTASQHVLEKSGLVRKGERAFPHPQYAASGPLAWFEADRVPWLAAHAPHLEP